MAHESCCAAEARRVRESGDVRDGERRALETALYDVPAYEAWRALDPGAGADLDRRYAALPVLTKAELRDGGPAAFAPRGQDVDAGLRAGEIEIARTSGSTDDQVEVAFDAAWWQASEHAAWQLNAHARRVATGAHREAVVASARCVGPGYTTQTLSMAERTLGRHLFLNQRLNPAEWTDADIRRMAAELDEFAPAALEGDPAYLAPFARRADELGLSLRQPQLITLTYSYPSRLYLRQIRQSFRAPIASSYGSTETGHVFFECEHGRLHQNVEHCRVDFAPWAARHGGPGRGRMLVTTLRNPWFFVLRYDLADVARRDDRGPCPCGRDEGLTLAAIEGRVKDVTFGSDGGAITVDDLDAALAAAPNLHAWQLELPRPGLLQMRIMADRDQENHARQAVREVLSSVYGGDVKAEVNAVGALENELSGKFRFARAAYPVNHDVLWTNL